MEHKKILIASLSAIFMFLAALFIASAACDTWSHTCSASYTKYDYSESQSTSTLTVYESCDISPATYNSLGSCGATLQSRTMSSECPQCWTDTHKCKSTTWHCSRTLGSYDYSYFRTTSSVTYYTSCTISPTEKQRRINLGYTYEWTDRTYSASPGEWTDLHTLGQCPEGYTGDLGSSCSSNSQCNAGLYCKSSTKKCTDVSYTHTECQNNQCVSVSGSGSNQCSSIYDCDSCYGVSCNSPPNTQCYSSSGSCSGGSCSYTKKAVGTGCGIDKICNSAGYCVENQPIQLTFWEDMAGKALSSGDLGDTFTMKAVGNVTGRQVEFKVYKDELIDNLVSTQTSSTGKASVLLNQSGAYYFTVKVTGSEASSVQSGQLTVSNVYSNSPPKANIISPVEKGAYFVNTAVAFYDNGTDVDDTVSSRAWAFSDGSSAQGQNGSHIFTSTGMHSATLRVTDSRGAASEAKVTFLVIGTGNAIYSSILQPFHRQAVISDKLVVAYNASDTYALEVELSGACSYKVTCAAGRCPSATMNSPACAGSQALPISSSPQPYQDIEFNWSFKEGSRIAGSANGNGKVSGTYGFASYGEKNITLKVKHEPSGLSSTSSREFILFNQRQCSSSGAQWYSVSNGLIDGTYDTVATTKCSGLDGAAGTKDDCCPRGNYCSIDILNPGCRLDTDVNGNLRQCKDYTTEQQCEDDPSQRVMNDVLWDFYSCGQTVDGENVLCSCAWNQQNSTCEFSTNARAASEAINGTVSSCTYWTETSECMNGYQNVIIHASSEGGSNPACVDSTQLLPCGKPVIALPFFSIINFAAALALTATIYFAMGRFSVDKAKI